MNKAVGSNVWKMYVIRTLRWFLVVMPVIIPFYRANGLNLTQVMIIQAVFGLAIVVFEIPSGYFSDQSC